MLKNNVALAIFTKTPGLSNLKTRLSISTGRQFVNELQTLNCQAIEETVRQLKGVDCYWALAEKEAIGLELWSGLENIYQGEGLLGERLHSIYSTLKKQYSKIIFIGSDGPQITNEIITSSINLLDQYEFVLGPATDGGYYIFGGKTDIPKSLWCSVPYSCNQTFSVFYKKLNQHGNIATLNSLTDIDDIHSIKKVLKEFGKLKDLRPTQQKIRQMLEEVIC